jgi:pyruvate,water dikinase
LYGFPQDIEWAWAGETLHLLQSRPVTSLFPLPDGLPVEPLKVFFSFAAVQGMLDPLTPLGRDALREIFAAGSGLLGVQVTRETQSVLYIAGERLWVNFTPVLSNSVGRRIVPAALGLLEPTVRQAVEQIWSDPRLQPGRPGVSLHARLQIGRFFLPLAANVILNLIAPRRRREMIIRHGERVLEWMQRRCAAVNDDRWQKLSQQADLLPDLATGRLRRTFTLFISAVVAGMASWNIINLLAGVDPRDQASETGSGTRDLVLQVTRGMPYNPTTEMDLLLWKIAKTIRRDPSSWQVFHNTSPSKLAARFHHGDLPEVGLKLVSRFLDRYGGRGLAEIDLGRTRWAEDPTHVFEMLSSFLQIEDNALAPDVIFARAAESAQAAVDRLAATVG